MQPDLHNDLVEFVPSLWKAAIAAATAACDEGTLNAAQLKELFKLTLSAARFSKRILNAEELDLWEAPHWDALREKLASSERFKSSAGLLDSCRQMTRLARGSKEEAAKPARVKTNGIEGKTKPKRKAEDVARTERTKEKSSRKKAKHV